MPPVVKKRISSDLSTCKTIQVDSETVKKLRLIHVNKVKEPQLQLRGACTSTEVLHMLLQHEKRVQSDQDSFDTDIRELLTHYTHEKNEAVRCKIISLISAIVDRSDTPPFELLVETLLTFAKNEKSHRVLSQLIKALARLGRFLTDDTILHIQIISTAKQLLSDSNVNVRVSSLDLIGRLVSDDCSTAISENLQEFLGHHALDTDSRVRTAALQALLTMSERGEKINKSLYDVSSDCLKDDVECVRLAALKLVWVICQQYPNEPSEIEEVCLLDDGFVKICNVINDISRVVRTEAAGLLGSLHNVSPKFLRQTLDKKLMSSMRRKASAHERARESFMSGEWATGQKWAADAPREELNPDDISLISIGACGAFVHGLEDEFLEVRNATLISLCELACKNPMFAIFSQDSIIDMFNDEIESVRLNAIICLKKIGSNIILREDQLEIILGVLQDFSATTRDTLRDMIGEMKMSTKACLLACVAAIVDNLARYPQDYESVLRLMKRLGRNHPELSSAIMPSVLGMHPYFDTPEPNIDEPSYVSVLVMILNAAEHHPCMFSLFPEHIWRQYKLLRASLPELIPALRERGDINATKSPLSSTQICDVYINDTISRLNNIDSLNPSTARQLLSILIKDLIRMDQMLLGEVATPDWMRLFLTCQSDIISFVEVYKGQSCTDGISLSNFVKVLKHCEELKYVYSGLNHDHLLKVFETEIKTLCFLVATQRDNPLTNQIRHCITATMENLQNLSTTHKLELDPFIRALAENIPSCSDNAITIETINHCIHLVNPSCFRTSFLVKRLSAVIREPSLSFKDKPIKFTAGMTTAVSFVASVFNSTSLDNLRISVTYPDMTVHHSLISVNDISHISDLECTINTKVILSHSLTTDPFEIAIGLVLVPTPSILQHISGDDHFTLKLCKPVNVCLAPQTFKR